MVGTGQGGVEVFWEIRVLNREAEVLGEDELTEEEMSPPISDFLY